MNIPETFITPGAIDLHTHLREPSTNTAETIESGTRAALLGGFVLVADMPNNIGMPVWTLERLIAKQEIAEKTSHIPTAFYAGAQPESDNVSELERMAPHAIGLKLYGDPTTGNNQTYEALDFEDIIEEWHRVAPNKPIMFHAGRENLEDMINLVAGAYEQPFHVCHVNDPEQVELVGDSKEDDMNVTCGICPHHLLKTSHDKHTQGVFAEMMPELAKQSDAEKLMYLLEEGDIDVIETDFAPHSLEAKFKAEHEGGHCYGVPGIEHVMSLLFYQVHKERLSMERLLDATHTKPAEILGVKMEDSTYVRWNNEGGAYRIGEEDVQASCGWTPYMGMLAVGRVEYVQISGNTLLMPLGVEIRKHPEIVEKRGHVIF